MTLVISMSNMRGGVGKTTTTISVGYELARRGKRVLLGDFDSQRTLSIYLGVEPKPGKPTTHALLTEPTEANVRGAIISYNGTATRPVRFDGHACLHVIPGARTITQASKQFDRTRDRQPVRSFDAVISYAVQAFLTEYDYFLLDPSPAADDVTAAVTNAAHGVITPLAAEPLSIEGVTDLLGDLQDLNESRAALITALAQDHARVQMPREVHLLGLLAAKVLPGQERVAESLWADLDQVGIGHFNRTSIPCTPVGWAAPAEHVPIAVLDPNDLAVQAYGHVVDHLLAWNPA
ncbi:MAG: AAA family ATPase [Ktedonobacterales bacterium]|nr:AAA family ATPase [Ktedonobacterales bacterium]